MAKIWTRIRDTIDRHGIAGLVSVVDVDGSAPREAGARLVVQPDGGFFGTIGGGRLEFEAIASARATLAKGRGRAEFRNWPLGPNLGQCCGGRVRTLTETFDARDAATVRRLADAEQSGAFVTMSRVGDDGRIARVLAPHAGAGAPLSLQPRASSKRPASASSSAKRPRRCSCSARVMSAGPWFWRWRRCRSRCAGSTAGRTSFRTTYRRTSSPSAPTMPSANWPKRRATPWSWS